MASISESTLAGVSDRQYGEPCPHLPSWTSTGASSRPQSVSSYTQVEAGGAEPAAAQHGRRLQVAQPLGEHVGPDGALADRIGIRRLAVTGLLLQALGMGWIGLVAAPGISYQALVVPMSLSGAGFAAAIPVLTRSAISQVAPADLGKASGVYSTFRQLGGAFGVAILAAVFAATGGYRSAAAFSDGYTATLLVAGAAALAGAAVAAALPGALRRPAPPDTHGRMSYLWPRSRGPAILSPASSDQYTRRGAERLGLGPRWVPLVSPDHCGGGEWHEHACGLVPVIRTHWAGGDKSRRPPTLPTAATRSPRRGSSGGWPRKDASSCA
jgi:hypothetical protein